MTGDDLAEKVAAVLGAHERIGQVTCGCGTEFHDGSKPIATWGPAHRAHLAAALLPLIREREAAAWEEGWQAGCNDCQYGDDNAEPWTPNPYAGSEGGE